MGGLVAEKVVRNSRGNRAEVVRDGSEARRGWTCQETTDSQ